MRALIIPGNGCPPFPKSIASCNFYGHLQCKLQESKLFDEVIACSMPDPLAARRSIWVPHIINEVKVNAETILIGHSSGAECVMRIAEEEKLAGIVLVSACVSDLGDAGERASGWYPPSGGPWKWDMIKRNAGWRMQFYSTDDCFINAQEAHDVRDALQTEYFEFNDRNHFFEPFDEIVDEIIRKVS